MKSILAVGLMILFVAVRLPCEAEHIPPVGCRDLNSAVAKALCDNSPLDGEVVECAVVHSVADGAKIATLFKSFGVSVPAKIYTKGDIRELKSAISPF